jgi:hypothetical protein
MASQAPASSGASIPSTATSSSYDAEYDPARIKAIANYRPGIPNKLTADGKNAGVTVNNIDSSKKVVQGGSGSSSVAASTFNYDIINLLLDRVTNPDIRTA